MRPCQPFMPLLDSKHNLVLHSLGLSHPAPSFLPYSHRIHRYSVITSSAPVEQAEDFGAPLVVVQRKLPIA